VNTWIDAGAIWIEVSRDHIEAVSRLMDEAHGGLNLITDAHLAALAIDHRAVIYSNDRDFSRFKGLKVVNPVG
jgi:predicted nucleic acid-binding protein